MVNLDLTEREEAALTAAVVEHYHRLKDAAADTTYGAMITDEGSLVAREVWRKVEAQIGLGEWT